MKLRTTLAVQLKFADGVDFKSIHETVSGISDRTG